MTDSKVISCFLAKVGRCQERNHAKLSSYKSFCGLCWNSEIRV